MPYPDYMYRFVWKRLYVSFCLKNINNTFYFASRLDFNHCPSVFPYYWSSPGFNSKWVYIAAILGGYFNQLNYNIKPATEEGAPDPKFLVRRKKEEKRTGLTLHSFYFYTICSSKVRSPAHPTNNLRTYETGTWRRRARALTHHLNQSGTLTSWESRLTTKLKPARRTYKNSVLFVGKLSNFLGNSSN